MIEEAARKADVLDAEAPTTHQLLLSQAISLKRIADALAMFTPPVISGDISIPDFDALNHPPSRLIHVPPFPEGPIYWSEEEIRRLCLSAGMEKPHAPGSMMIVAVANEAIAIMRDRAAS
jgi:hypothetical protein